MEGADLVVGHLKKVKRLSRDSRFRFCLLDVGQDQDIAVMSAAANVRAGVKVLVCLEGGTVLGTGEVVHAVIIEDVESRGILCGPVELGWEEGASGESVVHLSLDFEVGDVVEWGYFEEETVRESLTNWTLKHDVEDSSGASVSAGD
jgi:tRNA-binding EMAP/Myf-like protein